MTGDLWQCKHKSCGASRPATSSWCQHGVHRCGRQSSRPYAGLPHLLPRPAANTLSFVARVHQTVNQLWQCPATPNWTVTMWPCNWDHFYSWASTKKLHHCWTLTNILFMKIWVMNASWNCTVHRCVQIIYLTFSVHQSVAHYGTDAVAKSLFTQLIRKCHSFQVTVCIY